MKSMNCILAGAVCAVTGALAGGYLVCKSGRAVLAQQQRQMKRVESYFHILNQWVMIKNRGIKLETFFADNHYTRVGIYGFAPLGQRLAEELKGSAVVETAYFIDRNEAYIRGEKNVYAPSADLPKVDVIVVTAAASYHEIEKTLKRMVDCPVISLEDVIYDIA